MSDFDLTVEEIFANKNEFIQQARAFQSPESFNQTTIGGVIGTGISFLDIPNKGDRILGDPRARPLPFAFYRDMYRGGPTATDWIRKYEQETEDSWHERRQRLFPVNYTQQVVNKLVESEYGRPLIFEFLEKDDSPEQQAYDAWKKILNINSVRISQARQRAIDGHSILQVLWDEEKGQVRLKKILPEHWFPILGDTFEDIEAVIIEKPKRRFDRESNAFQNITRTEVYTQDDIGIWEADIRLDPPNNQVKLGFLPFVVWQGTRLTGFPLGDSLVRSAAELNHAVNIVANNIAEMIRYQGFSLLVIQGEVGGLEIDPKTGRATLRLSERAFLNVAADGGAASFETPNPKISESLEVLDKWTRYMFETSAIPLAAISPQQGHVESGVSRQISFQPLVEKVNELWTEDEFVERKLFRKMMATHNAFQTSEGAKLDLEVKFNIKEPQGAVMPIDETTKLSNTILSQDSGYITQEDALIRLNPFLTGKEIDMKLAELEKEKVKNQEEEDAKITNIMNGKNQLKEKEEA